MYNDNVLICKWEVTDHTNDSMIPTDCCQENQDLIDFTNDDMIFKFEVSTNH